MEDVSWLNPLKAQVFATTRWSVVLACRNDDHTRSHRALTEMCQSYWQPVYACIRHHGRGEHEAQDLTQDFFVWLLNGKFKHADQSKGRFRAYISVALRNFLHDSHRRQWTWRKGRGKTFISFDSQTMEEAYAPGLVTQITPERLYDQRWACLVIEHAFQQLRIELTAQGREALIGHFDAIFTGDTRAFPFEEVAARLGLSVGALHKALHHWRGRFQTLLREEVGRTVRSKSEIESEIRYLLQLFTQRA